MTFVILALCPLVLLTFIRLEERDRREVAVAVVLALLLIEALVYPNQNFVPGGLFHPSLLGRPLRLPEVVIPVALLARILVHGFPRRIGPTAIAWAAWATWHGVGLPVGIAMGNPFGEALFQTKAVIYLGGGLALVSGVPISRLVNRSTIRALVIGLGVIAAISAPVTLANGGLRLSLPLMPGMTFGQLSADAATILFTVAVVGLMLEAARRRRRLLTCLAVVPLLLTPLAATQRAAILGAAVIALTLAVVAVGPTWAQRIRSTPTEALMLLCIVLVPVLTTVMVRASLSTSTSTRTEIVPLAEAVNETFLATRKLQSASTRQNLWSEGLSQAQDYPVVGWGLGKTYSVERAYDSSVFIVGGGFHNILIDLLVRRGVVGVLLFLVAVAMSLRDALRVWRTHADRFVAVFAGACGVALLGLLAKGMVESVFEKFRLATLLGLLLGAVASAATSMGTTADAAGGGAAEAARATT